MDLRKKDVAELLSLSEETIDRLGLPCYTLGGEVRYNRSEVEEWMVQALKEERVPLPFGEGQGDQAPWQQFGLYRAIYRGDVLDEVYAGSKEELIYTTLDTAADTLHVNPEVVAELLLEREHLMPTALNNGIAIPHTREFLLGGLFDAVVVVYPKTPLEWGALDNLPVHTLFFLFACDDRRHLNLLAKIAHFINHEEHVAFLQTRPSKTVLLERLKEWEASLKLPVTV